MPKQILVEDWILGLLRILRVGEEIDLLEGATEGPRMRLLVKRTSRHQLVVNRKPPAKAQMKKKQSKTSKRIIVVSRKGQVLYDSGSRSKVRATSKRTTRSR